jgi:hypothetical protein
VAPLTDEDASSIRAVDEETAAYDVPTKQPMKQLVTSAVVVTDEQRDERSNDDGGILLFLPLVLAAVVHRREAVGTNDDATR